MRAEDCKTNDDIMLHLVSHLQWIDTDVKVGPWEQKMGFRRHCFISQVWHNTQTNAWAFHVSDDEFAGEPNMGVYKSFTELLLGVAQKYSVHWDLQDAQYICLENNLKNSNIIIHLTDMSSTATVTASTTPRFMGRVKWFNNKAGYGFITVTDGPKAGTDVFVHHTTIKVDGELYKYLVQGEYVEFSLLNSTSTNHEFQAGDVSGIRGGKLMCETRRDLRTARQSYNKNDQSPAPENRPTTPPLPPRARRAPARPPRAPRANRRPVDGVAV
jgi:cold shock protein